MTFLSEKEPLVAKQVIVVRKDLNMRKGKMVAQGCHASLGVYKLIDDDLGPFGAGQFYHIRSAFLDWMQPGEFSKICVSVDSELELLRIENAARNARLPVYVVTDSGRTEFHGVPTITCLAIGPVYSDVVDKITGELKLL